MERDSAKNSKREERLGTPGLDGVLSFLAQLHEIGTRTAILCPGGRNAPMVQALELIQKPWGWDILTFVDERSAAFFALGRSKRDQSPVLVSVTSGTAAAELFPAAIEAHATDVPLIFTTADRPRAHRGSGSPQSMQQVNLYQGYAPTLVDWQEGEEFPLWIGRWNKRSPVHINLCHDEPLWEKKPLSAPLAPISVTPATRWPEITTVFPSFKKPLVLLGSLAVDEREAVEKFCRWYQAPILAEASSGLREAQLPTLAHAADRVVRRWLKNNEFDGVIRLGGVPSWRLWRDLENWGGTVVTFGRTQWSGLPDRTFTIGELGPWLERWQKSGNKTEVRTPFHLEDKILSDKREHLHTDFPHSEPALVRQLSIHAAPGALMYLGNSRPIRDWNEQALLSKKFEIQENRGLNGIDGQISSFYGHAQEDLENWALIGDLTTIYDMQGPWALRYLSANTRTRLVVINNSGGQIFSRMFPSPMFLNKHQNQFKALAEFWGLTYTQDLNTMAQHALIELTPDLEQTQSFRDQWEKF
jgi:2-succinyl-5-enolpyruvyl-6-hydroxy-3-cyclohexene-1-carboxylate synthase